MRASPVFFDERGGALMLVHIVKVGPLEDGTSLYVPIGEDPDSGAPTDLDPVRADTDVEGLRRILTQRTTETLVCAVELKEAAASLHLPSAELPAEVEGTRVQIAIDNAQNHELDQVENPRSLLRLMVATREFLESKIATRWPPGHTFMVRLDGDRRDEFGGWITTTPELTVNLLIGTHTDVRSIAGVPGDQQRERLSRLDHVSVSLVSPPPYALEPIRAFYGIEAMPKLTKVAKTNKVLPSDEDALVAAGVMSALARFDKVMGMVDSVTATAGRTVRTYVVAVPPVVAPTLPDEVRIRYETGNAHAPTGIGSICIDVHYDDSVRLINERHGKQRVWLAWLEPTFAPAFAGATSEAGFPGSPSVRIAPAGASSFAVSVRADDGTIQYASGFLSPEYGPVSRLFMRLVGQISGDAVLGFLPDSETTFVRDVVET
ncbi:MAG: hypothetical protein AB7T06_34795 [Kofleriaceae bacterium]